MTQKPNEKFDYHKQCNTCNLSDHITQDIHDWFEELGPQYTELSRRLDAEYSIRISPDALSNHLKFHSVQDIDNPTPLLGVVKPPKGWEPKVELHGDEGTVTSTPQKNGKLTDFTQILEEFDIDPTVFEVLDETLSISKWEPIPDEWRTAYRFKIRKKRSDALHLPTLFQQVERSELRLKTPEPTRKDPNKTLVVPFADLQVGKVGSRGGTIELLDRIQEKKEKLLNYIHKVSCGSAVFADGGDIVENFENVKQQMHTNDLPLMDQVDLAGTVEEEFLDLISRNHDSTDSIVVPSNHATWRSGKDVLGKPTDDWGIFIMKQIEKSYKKYASDIHSSVTFHYPEEWRKSITIDVQGYGLGLVHGDDVNRPEAIPDWWAKQIHGGGPTALADILISNHFHTFRLQPSGRNPRTGRQKWWVATPTLDNGSDWYANGPGGGDSDPGLLAFVVDKEKGFDLQSFAVL